MTHSEQINELAAALAKAQGAIRNAPKTSDNPYFKSKYADLAEVWDAIREPFASNGLSVLQVPETADTESGPIVIVHTTIMHASGQWSSGSLAMKPVKSDPQGIGSAITYARRYSLQSMTGVAGEDDDGNAASGKDAPKGESTPKTYTKAKPGDIIKADSGSPQTIAATADQSTTPAAEYLTVDEAKSVYMHLRTYFKKSLKEKDIEELVHQWCVAQGLIDVKGDGTLFKVRRDYNGVSGVVRTKAALEKYITERIAEQVNESVHRDGFSGGL